jgi:hypothetical protein
MLMGNLLNLEAYTKSRVFKAALLGLVALFWGPLVTFYTRIDLNHVPYPITGLCSVMTNKLDTLGRLSALDLSTYPYEEAKALIRELGRFGAMNYALHPGKTITRGRPNDLVDGRPVSFTRADQLSYKPQKYQLHIPACQYTVQDDVLWLSNP